MLSKPMLTIHEIADLLKVKEATVRVWIRHRELPAIEFNREYRVAAKHLDQFISARLTVDPDHDFGPVKRSDDHCN